MIDEPVSGPFAEHLARILPWPSGLVAGASISSGLLSGAGPIMLRGFTAT
jgi:hypothetical protein